MTLTLVLMSIAFDRQLAFSICALDAELATHFLHPLDHVLQVLLRRPARRLAQTVIDPERPHLHLVMLSRSFHRGKLKEH